jgi:hypothetical protein
MAEHPVEACYGSPLHCHWHDRDEPGEPFRVCFECRHAFMSAAELLAGHNRQLARYPEIAPEADVAKVFCCPFCLHDW